MVWKNEKQRHSVARKGIKTAKPKIKKVDLQTKWYDFLKESGERIDNYEMYHDDLGVMYSFPSGLPGTIDFSINIQNPLNQLYGEEYLDNLSTEQHNKLVDKTMKFFNTYYPELGFDPSHIKYEDYISFNISVDVPKDKINELYKKKSTAIPNNYLGSFMEGFYTKSGMYKFATDWNMYHTGINNYKKFMKGE